MRSVPAALFRVRPAEVERVLMMLAFSLLAVGGIVITGQLLGRSLFLSSVPASSIPLRFIVPPLALVGTIGLYTRLAQSVRKPRLILLTLTAVLVGTLCARWMLETPLREKVGFLLGLFTFFEIAAGLTMILFWTLAADLFTSREAKRLFPVISGGSALSNVAFGAFLVGGATSVRPENLVWVIALSVTLSMAIVLRLVTRYPPAADHPVTSADPAPTAGWTQGLREVFASPLMLVIGSIVVVVALISNIADYQLDLALKLSYTDDTQAMVRLLALLRLGAGILAVVLQFFVVSWLMERFGILPALLLLPMAIAGGSTAILLTGGALWAVTIPRAADFSLKYTVNDSAFNLLYLPLPAALRSRAKAVVDGMIKPLLVSALGLAFLAIARMDGFDLIHWSWPVLLLVVVWAGLLARGSREYVRALSHSLLMRRLDLGKTTLDLSDETSTRALVSALEQPDSLRIVHTISLLRESSDLDWSDRIAGLVEHPAAEVRGAAVGYLGERSTQDHVSAVKSLLDDGDANVRCEAVAAYGRLLGAEAVRDLLPLIDDHDRAVRGATIVALIRHGGLSGFLHAGRPLNELLEHDDDADRAQGAKLLGELAVQSFFGPLLELIGDSDSTVRLAAVEAAEQVAAPELIPGLLGAFDDPALRRSSIRAICACSGADVGAIERLIQANDVPADVCSALVGALVPHGPPAVAILERLLDDDRATIRAAVYAALLKLRTDGKEPGIHRDRLLASLERELRDAFERQLCVEDLEEDPSTLLAECMQHRIRADEDRVLAALALAYPTLPIEDLREALRHHDPRVQANAVELLDNVVAAGKPLLIPFIAGTRSEKLVVAERRLDLQRQSRAERLHALMNSGDPWLSACADFADNTTRKIRQEGSPMALAPLEKVLFLKQVPLFREIPGEQVAGILPIVDEVSFQQGDQIIRQGDAGDALYIIVEGEVEIEIDGRNMDRVLGSRDVIGELAILTGDARAATCTARSEVLTLRVSHDSFWELMRERPEVTIGVMRIVLGYLKKP